MGRSRSLLSPPVGDYFPDVHLRERFVPLCPHVARIASPSWSARAPVASVPALAVVAARVDEVDPASGESSAFLVETTARLQRGYRRCCNRTGRSATPRIGRAGQPVVQGSTT